MVTMRVFFAMLCLVAENYGSVQSLAGATPPANPSTIDTEMNWAGSSDIFYFCPSSKGRGWGGVQRGGGISLKSEEKGGKRGGGGGVDAGKGSGALLGGGGVLNIYFEG